MSVSEMCAISVVVPTYNRKDSLTVTLDGLARQQFSQLFEVVVVSDGSTDGTDDLLTERARLARDPYRLRPVLQANAGPARARNHGVSVASNDVIVFLDDDVEPCPDCLRVHAAHHAQDDTIIVVGPMSPDPARQRLESPWIAWEHAMLQKQYHNFKTGVWPELGPNHFYSGNASVRREHLLAVGGFDETFKRQEDVELAVRLQRDRGLHFVFDAAADGIHRPFRTFESWLRVPYAYGQLDVVRARRGDASWSVVRHGYQARSLPTKLLASLALSFPPLGVLERKSLLFAARAAHSIGLPRVSRGALSVLYNVHYLEGAAAEIGSPRQLKAVLAGADPV